ncbi:MAG: L-histidine N(alpha)-methyltransferase, partial [Pseudomonadota bacterium]
MATKEQAIKLHDYHPSEGDLETEILKGLSGDPKQLPPKYFYDKVGAELFDAITETPEYYPTRTEQTIMLDRAQEIAELVGPQASLIEFGSGSGLKTRILLENLPELAAYVPVDISKKQLLDVAREFSGDYPNIEVLPVCADFTKPFDLPSPRVMPLKNVVFFPGSTIGNFLPDHALELLKAMARIACKGGALIIGVDLKKDEKILERAYNDEAGVTAQFNRNMLVLELLEIKISLELPIHANE